jgi:hypothetical protein
MSPVRTTAHRPAISGGNGFRSTAIASAEIGQAEDERLAHLAARAGDEDDGAASRLHHNGGDIVPLTRPEEISPWTPMLKDRAA